MSRNPDSDSRLTGAAPATSATGSAGGSKRGERTRQTGPDRDSQPKPIRQRLAWLPIPVFLVAIVVLWAVGTEAPRESVELGIALNVVFSVMVSLVVAFLIGRTFLVRGQPGMLLLGCGIVIWGVAAVVGFAATRAGAPPIVVHNTCVFLAAVCHVIGSYLLLKVRPGLRNAGLWLAAGYTMALGAVAIIALAGLAGRLPTFFIQGQGGTPLRQVVLGLSIAMFLVTAYLLRKAIPASRSPFAYWYALALGLIAVGLFGVMIQPVRGSLLGWAGRAAQFASGIYMFVAAVASVRETGAWMLPIEAALRQSEERYRALFTSISEAFMIQEAIRDRAGNIIDFRFLEVNPAFEVQTGLSGVVGKTMREVMPDIEQEWIENYAEVARTGKPVRFEQRAASLGRWLDVFASRVGESGSAGVAILFNDITARKRAEMALMEQTKQLEAANRELESFSYTVSHDLKAPLRAIGGFSRMILKKEEARFDEETRRRFQVITENCQTMGRMIDDLLAFSRLSREALTKTSLGMPALVQDVWQELITIHPDRAMTLKVVPMPAAFGDQTLVRQVYANLLENAVKFTKSREAALIEAGSIVKDNETVYYIKDNGIGFDMQFYDKLFGVFQRLHSNEGYEGTGIGLATVQRIINSHGGRVWAEGEVDKGATFYFTLPTSQK